MIFLACLLVASYPLADLILTLVESTNNKED